MCITSNKLKFSVLLLWQLGCDSSPFAHALQCVAMSAVCLFVNAAVFRTSSVGIACSYSVTCSDNQFCRSCKYYDFETVQHCHVTTTASPETGPSGEAL